MTKPFKILFPELNEAQLKLLYGAVLEVIGEDEPADWQVIWANGKKHKIDDPVIVEENKRKAAQRYRLKELMK